MHIPTTSTTPCQTFTPILLTTTHYFLCTFAFKRRSRAYSKEWKKLLVLHSHHVLLCMILILNLWRLEVLQKWFNHLVNDHITERERHFGDHQLTDEVIFHSITSLFSPLYPGKPSYVTFAKKLSREESECSRGIIDFVRQVIGNAVCCHTPCWLVAAARITIVIG